MSAVTEAPDTPRRERLLPVDLYRAAARLYGIRETDRTLVLAGRLTVVTVGRRRFYPWRELVAAMPDWAQQVTTHCTDAELRRTWRR